MFLHRDASPAGGTEVARTTLDEAPRPEPKVNSDPAPKTATPALASRVDDLLVKNDAASAARVLLAADPHEFGDAAVRERAFRAADALVAAGDVAKDASATSLRLDAR